jgi:hypothetical protein
MEGNSAEVHPGKSTESSPTRSTEVQSKVQLKRELGLFSAVNLTVGCMIGMQHALLILAAFNLARFLTLHTVRFLCHDRWIAR